MFFPEYDLRLRGAIALQRMIARRDPQEDLLELGAKLVNLRDRLQAPASDDFVAWGELLCAMQFLVRWEHALRHGEPDGDRHVRAARLRARDVLRATTNGSALHQAASAVVAVRDPDDIQRATTVLLRVRLPLPFPAPPGRTGGVSTSPAPDPAPPTPPMLAFLRFYLDNQPLSITPLSHEESF